MATIFSMLDNAFEALTGAPPTLMNFAQMSLATGFVLLGVFYIVHVIQIALLRSMSDKERQELAEELSQK